MAKSIAIFQEKKGNNFIGNKIYYYRTKNPDWWAVSVGKPILGKVPEHMTGSGSWMSRKQFKTIASLEKHHKPDNIFRVK